LASAQTENADRKKASKPLGLWRLTGAAFGGVIGSGWLLGASMTAKIAGPASVLAWLLGGVALLAIALVMVEVSKLKNISGGLVWWPVHSSGRVVGTVAAAAIWIVYAANPPTEALAMVTVTSKSGHGIPGLFRNDSLTFAGYLFALAVLVVLVGVNLLGVAWFARVNTAVTVAKFVVPVVTIGLILYSTLRPNHYNHFSTHGALFPRGFGSSLTAITTGGVIYAYTGFQGPFDLGDEVKNPEVNLRRSVVLSLVLAIVVYTALQIVFIGAVPGADLAGGWSHLHSVRGDITNSPFITLAAGLNLTWFTWVLTADAFFSPAGSALVFTTALAHEIESLSFNKLLHEFFGRRIQPRNVLRNAFLCNLAIGAALLGFGNWGTLVKATSILVLFVYAMTAIPHVVLTQARGEKLTMRWRILTPATFVLASMILYWAGWAWVWRSFAILLGLSAVLHVYRWSNNRNSSKLRDELRAAVWMIGYFGGLLLLSGLGSFGGINLLTKPWDSLSAAGVALASFEWAVRLSNTYVDNHGLPKESPDEPE
jgi:amino acid transporter